MTSWRETASQQAQDDLDGLLDPAFGFAQRQLAAHGEFFPFGAVVDRDGRSAMAAAPPDPANDRPSSPDVLASLYAQLTARRDELRAVAIVADVRLEGGDAVRVELEHVEGPALVVLMPYRTRRFGRGPAYGPLDAIPGTRRIWR